MFKIKPIYYCLWSFCILNAGMLCAETLTPKGISVKQSIKHDISIPLRYMQGDKNLFNGQNQLNTLKKIISVEPSQLLQPIAEKSLVSLKGFQGIGIGLGNYQVTSPKPDLSASVGLTQYVQWADSEIAVFDKSTGQLFPGFPKPGNSIWAGFGGPCETSLLGGSTLKYDQLAQRWVVSQQAYADLNLGPYYQCIAVSTGEDATGSYFRYSFQFDSLSEDPKLGLWPDAYYLSMNMLGRASYGPQFCALERDKMIAGLPTNIQCRQLSNLQSGLLQPADLDGLQLPPAGSPEFFAGLNFTGALILTKFYVDFANPNNSNVEILSIPVAAFTKSCRSINGNRCAVQPDTLDRLNVVSNRLMSRFVYRQFRDYGSMVATHTIEGLAPKFAPAIRWYELRVAKTNPNFIPVLHQQSTLAPDSKNRFLGSIAIDRFTNIAVGYSVTSSLIYPSMELGYHNFNDQLNTMIIQPLVTGRGSQVNGISSWGSTSVMSVDPVDECTFWYTNEYLKETGSLNWSTYIVKFKLAPCA